MAFGFRPALALIPLAILLSVSAFASAAGSGDFGAVLEKIGNPISIDGNVSFQKIIPGYNYSSQIKVAWAVPMEAVMGLDNQAVTIYVQARPFADNSWLSFEMDGKKRKTLSFVLVCNVTDGACGVGSVLVKRFTATVSAPADASNVHYENIVIESSLSPFPPTEEALAEKQAEAALAEVRATADADQALLPNSVLVADAQDTLALAAQAVDDGDFDGALTLVRQADYSLGMAVAQAREAAEREAQAVQAAEDAAAAEASADASLASGISGFFTGNSLPFAVGIVAVAALVIMFMSARRVQDVDVDRLMEDGDGLLSKKGGESNLNALNRSADNDGDSATSFKLGQNQARPGDPGYSPKTSFLDRYGKK